MGVRTSATVHAMDAAAGAIAVGAVPVLAAAIESRPADMGPCAGGVLMQVPIGERFAGLNAMTAAVGESRAAGNARRAALQRRRGLTTSSGLKATMESRGIVPRIEASG